MKHFGLFLLLLSSLAAGASRNQPRSLCEGVLQEAGSELHLAIIDVAENRLAEARARIKNGNFTEDQRLLLWRLMLGRGGKFAVEDISTFRFSAETLKESIFEIAKTDPETSLALVAQVRLSPEELFLLLKELSAQIDITSALTRLGELTESQRAELAVLQIQVRGEAAFLNNQYHYALGGSSALVPVMEALLKRGWFEADQVTGLRDLIPALSLEEKTRLALALAEHPSITEEWEKFEALANLLEVGKLPIEMQAEIAGTVFATNTNAKGWDLEYFRSLFDENDFITPFTFDSTSITDILAAAFKRLDRKVIRDREARDEFLFEAYEKRAVAMSAGVERLKKVLFARDGINTIAETYNLESLEDLHLVAPDQRRDLTRTLQEFAEQYPELLPKGFLPLLWDPVKNQSVALRMLQEYLSQNEGRWDNMPTSSLELIARLTGLDYAALKSSSLPKSPSELYALLMDIQDGIGEPAFKDIRIEPAVFEKRRDFLQLLQALRDLHSLIGDGTKGWKAAQREVGISSTAGITANELEAMKVRALQLVIASVREKLADYDVHFTAEQFQALEGQWGNLEPIWTLLSRFEGERQWHAEIPVLAQVFEASLQGNFRKKKFEGGFEVAERDADQDVELAHAQFFDIAKRAQRTAWMKPRWKVSAPAANRAEEVATLNAIREDLKSSVESPLAEVFTLPMEKVTKKFRSDLDKALEDEILQQDPLPVVEGLIASLAGKKNPEASARTLLRLGIDVLSEEGVKPERVRGAIRLIRAVLISQKGIEMPATAKVALGNAERAAKGLEKQTAGELLLTVVNADPKFLLTIGDAVKTASCQSYSTGGRIEALLGYVMDANVQAVVSYSVTQQHFETAAEFNRVAKAQAENRLVSVEFNGNKKEAVFTVKAAEGEKTEKIQSLPLGFAYQRQMLKLGWNEQQGEPGVRLEALYEQQHPHSETMQEMHEQILADLVKEMRIQDNEGTIRIPTTRNPGGVYSDLAEGQFTGEYTIP